MSRPVARRTVLGGSLAGVATAITGHQAAGGAPVRHPADRDAAAATRSLALPRTPLAHRARGLITKTQEPFLRNHSVRSFLFARAAAAEHGSVAGEDYDAELVFLICALHDMGLTARASHDVRFEVAGADLAAEFLETAGACAEVVDTVWLAIAVHTSPQLHDSRFFRRRGLELTVAQTGIGIDLDGPDGLSPGYAARVHAAYPRIGGGRALFAAIEDRGTANPASAPPATLAGELVHQRHPALPYPTLDQLLDANGWGE